MCCSLKTAAIGRFDFCARKNRNQGGFSVTTVEAAQICLTGMKCWKVGRGGRGWKQCEMLVPLGTKWHKSRKSIFILEF